MAGQRGVDVVVVAVVVVLLVEVVVVDTVVVVDVVGVTQLFVELSPIVTVVFGIWSGFVSNSDELSGESSVLGVLSSVSVVKLVVVVVELLLISVVKPVVVVVVVVVVVEEELLSVRLLKLFSTCCSKD